MYSSPEHAHKLRELKQLMQQYRAYHCVVAPNIPLAYYALGRRNPLPADWLINWEINRQPGRLITLAARNNTVVLVEKSFLQGEWFMPPNRADFSVVTEYIVQHFTPIAQTQYFIVYHGLSKPAPLPTTRKT
jgi:hypothetical protein